MNLTSIVKKLIACFCVLCAVSVSALAQKNIPVDSSKVDTLRIDPSNAVGGNASDFFTEVNYIPLETTEESTFGSISKMVITDDYFIIDDWTTHCILIFNRNGKFHAKIKCGEKAALYSFRVNQFTKQIIYAKDYGYKEFVYADYDGKVVKTLQTGGQYAKDEVNEGNDIIFFSANKAVSSYYVNDIDSTAKNYKTYDKSLIIYSDDKNKAYAQGLKFDTREVGSDIIRGGLGPLTSTGIDTTLFFSKDFQDIYTITPNTIKLSYRLLFPLQAQLPIDFLYNPIYKKKQMEYIQKHTGTIFCISNFFRVNNNLLFRTGIWNKWDNMEDNLIYNLKSGSLIAYKHITQDKLSYFLPIYDDSNYGVSFANSGLLACDGGYIYTSASSLGMFQYHDKYADQKADYPPALANYFKKGSKKDNPVIIQLKLKNEL